MLYEARRQSGMDINTISRKLHIRPDILHAMEEGDFERLPDRGYARNMVRGYAHIVGLDQNQISQMYLEELHMYETGRPLAAADTHRQASQSKRSGAEGVTRSSSLNPESQRRTSLRQASSNNPRNQGSLQRQSSSRRVYDAGPSSSRTQNAKSNRTSSRRTGSYDSTTSRSGVRSSSARNDSMRSYRRPSQDSRSNKKSPSANVPLTSLFASNFGKKKQQAGQSARPGVPSVYTQNKRSTPSVAQPTLKMSFLVVVALIAIILIVLAIVFSSGSKQTVDEVPQIPISGLTDTSGSTQSSSTSTPDTTSGSDVSTSQAQSQTQTNELTYTIEDGARTWVQISVDGEDDPLVEEVLEGPLTKTIEVESAVTFKTANPSPIKLTFNSTEVELTRLNGTEYYTYTAKPDTQSEASGTASSSTSSSSSTSTGSSSSEE